MFEITRRVDRPWQANLKLSDEEYMEIEKQKEKHDLTGPDFIRLCISEFVKQHPIA